MVESNIEGINLDNKVKKKKKLVPSNSEDKIINENIEKNVHDKKETPIKKLKKKRKSSEEDSDKNNLNIVLAENVIDCKIISQSKKIKLDLHNDSNGKTSELGNDIVETKKKKKLDKKDKLSTLKIKKPKENKSKKIEHETNIPINSGNLIKNNIFLSKNIDNVEKNVATVKKSKKVKTEKNSIEINNVTCDTSLSSDKADSNKSEIKESIATDKIENYRISPTILKKLQDQGINTLFPVQFRTYDSIYDGSDVIIQARTGSGKTLAFAIPIVDKLEIADNIAVRNRAPKVLVLAPTRELAQQVAKTFVSISSKLFVLCVYGGVNINLQLSKIRNGVDILVGTPGRIIDILNRKILDLSQLNYVVLDEVDRMLDMGFRDDVDTILAHRYTKEETKVNPQTLLFSATLPDWIGETAAKYLKADNTSLISFISNSDNKTSKTVDHMAIKCQRDDRASAIGNLLSVYGGSTGRTIVFTDKKKEADNLALSPILQNYAQVIHGDIPQEKRESVLKAFREGKFRCLIATDVAARGLDIPEVDLVIQCSVPENIDSYVHRSGRTGRAGRSGANIILFQHWEEKYIKWLQDKLNISIKIRHLPTVDEILKASADDLKKTLKEVPLETIELFTEQAELFIKELGAVNCVASAIAIIAGHKNIKNKSLLSMKEDYNTYHIISDKKFNYISYMWKALGNILPQDMLAEILYMKSCADQQSCVFDLPSKFDSDIMKLFASNNSLVIKKILTLPELFAPRFSNEKTSNSRNYNSNYTNNRAY